MTTLNLQVGVGADDGETYYNPPSNNPGTPAGFNATGTGVRVGGYASGSGWSYNSFFRFTGVSGLSGTTIDSAILKVYGSGPDAGSPETLISAWDAASPVAPTTGAEHDSAPRTMAGVAWDSPGLVTTGFTNSPEGKTVVQELADSYNPSTIIILWDDDLKLDAYNICNPEVYDDDPTKAAKLDITFTAGGTDRRVTVVHVELEIPTAPRKVQMSWAEIEAPIAARRAQVSWNELELPTGSRRGQVAQTGIELPFAPRRSRLSWAEIETPVLNRRGRVSQGAIEVPTAPRQIQLSWVELEAPDAARKILISWTEFEIPTSPRQGRLSWVEIEAPLAPRQGQVSWVELEVPSTPISPRGAQVSWVELELSNIELLPNTFQPPYRDRQVFVWYIPGILDPSDYEFASALTTGDFALTQKDQLWVYNGAIWKRIVTA